MIRRRKRRYLWLAMPLVLIALPFAIYGWLANARNAADAAQLAALAEPGHEVSFSPSLNTVVDADSAAAMDERPAPPKKLLARIKDLGMGFDGDVGIAVHSVEKGWAAQHDALRLYPQQSVSKTWVAMTLLDKVDSGEVALDETISLSRADLTIFHQPIRKKIGQGRFDTNLADLLRRAMTQSDNTANAALFRRVGGQPGVNNFFLRKNLDGIRIGRSEKDLQMAIAGMTWNESYSYGRTFWQARSKISVAKRAESMGAYLTDPMDGARPAAIADALVQLQRGTLLSPASTALLIGHMTASKTGKNRLRGGLEKGWILPHKTGTGQDLEKLSTAYNDVGLLISPKGNHYAIAVMIGATNRSVAERQKLMHAVTKAVIACETQGWAGC